MERRFVLFLVLSFAILIGYSSLMRRLNPPKPAPEAARQADRPEAAEPARAAADRAAEKGEEEASPARPAEDETNQPPATIQARHRAEPRTAGTLDHARLGRSERPVSDAGHADHQGGRPWRDSNLTTRAIATSTNATDIWVICRRRRSRKETAASSDSSVAAPRPTRPA